MDPQKMRQVQTTLRQLAEDHAKTVAACLTEALRVLGLGPGLFGSFVNQGSRPAGKSAGAGKAKQGLLDPQLLSVVYRGKRCFLGNTLPYRLLERLAGQPNRYVSYETLLDEVWHNQRSREAVRSVVKVLRAKLRSAGLGTVAAIIDGNVRGHYALMVDRLG